MNARRAFFLLAVSQVGTALVVLCYAILTR